MTQLFGISIDTLTSVLLTIAVVLVGTVVLLALSNVIFFKIGTRNIPRRRMQMVLIVFALMLSTTLLSSVLATGDVITATVQSVAIYNLGNVDELIEGGHGPIGTYPDEVYYNLLQREKHNSDITAIGAALREQNLLIADQTSRQVRSKVTALAVIPGSELGFGGMQDVNTGKHLTIAALEENEVYLNQTTAQLLNAHAGDTLYIYAQRWQGQRYTMRVAAIVKNGGLVGDNPFILSQAAPFRAIERDPDAINQIFISNHGGGIAGVGLSGRVTGEVERAIPDEVHVIQVKQQGVENSQKAQDIFSRIFVLFSLFALAIGLLLIFLIFVLLAAERRAEMGMARAIGVQRRHLVLMFLFEGAIYDLLSSFIGLLIGVGIGALLVAFLGPLLASFNFPLKLTFQPRSLIFAYCLGVIFTFGSVMLSSWLVSRMTVVEAMRDLPEPAHAPLSLGELGVGFLGLLGQLRRTRRRGAPLRSPWWRFATEGNRKGTSLRYVEANIEQGDRKGAPLRRVRRILLEQVPDLLIGFIRTLTQLGFLPLLAGYWAMQVGLENAQIIPFSLGVSLIVIGGGLFVQAVIGLLYQVVMHRLRTYRPVFLKVTRRLITTLIGAALVAYWALPFDVLARLGLPRFQGGIEVFFVASFMMVLGTVWALMTNADLIVRPLLALFSGLSRFYAMMKLASSYPLQRRFRTGLSVIMFSLVVFAMTVMVVITSAMQNNYVDINTQTGGYDIQATSYFKPLPSTDIRITLAQHGINPNVFSTIGVRNTSVVGVIQPSADAPRWSLYPAQVVSGGFLQGYGLHLVARAEGFSSDSAVWQALQSHSNYALIDSSALPFNPNVISNSPVYDPNAPTATAAGAPATPPSFPSQFTFSMSGVFQGDTSFPATPVWVTGMQQRGAVKLTIIGVVDNSDNGHFGLYIPSSAYSAGSLDSDLQLFLPDNQGYYSPQSYYFKVAPGQNKRALALALGSAFLDDGLEATVLEDAILQARGPRILLSDVLLGVVGMTLLLGVAALAITGTRAVIERRQQIGMLRALGCHRRLIQGAFLLESFLVGALGSIIGVILGLILAHNIFAVNFFEQFNLGLTFVIPWDQLAIIVGVALIATFLGALLPAWQAGKVAPAEALRYQ